ncbi:MAG: hypothetical protein L6V89_10700 [Oscillospiraceae bacterium]|nr:MAG: hypothetical protein L6V89_10700 [Oscillospiraceae bacterium]
MDKADRRREALYDETDIGEITVRRSRKSIKAEGAACVQETAAEQTAAKSLRSRIRTKPSASA